MTGYILFACFPSLSLLVVLPAVSLPCQVLLAGTMRRLGLLALLSAGVISVGVGVGVMFLEGTDGAGTLLLDVVVTWARTRAVRRVVLSVTCGDSWARRLYLRAGFAPIGEPQPLRPGFHLLSQPMELELSHDAA